MEVNLYTSCPSNNNDGVKWQRMFSRRFYCILFLANIGPGFKVSPLLSSENCLFLNSYRYAPPRLRNSLYIAIYACTLRMLHLYQQVEPRHKLFKRILFLISVQPRFCTFCMSFFFFFLEWHCWSEI